MPIDLATEAIGKPFLRLIDSAFVRQFVRVPFPVLTIKIGDLDVHRLRIQTIDVDVDAIRVGTRQIKWLDATNLAEPVLSNTAVERVCAQMLLSRVQAKIPAWHDQVEKTRFAADGTIAAVRRDDRWCLNFKPDRLTMAAALINHSRLSIAAVSSMLNSAVT